MRARCDRDPRHRAPRRRRRSRSRRPPRSASPSGRARPRPPVRSASGVISSEGRSRPVGDRLQPPDPVAARADHEAPGLGRGRQRRRAPRAPRRRPAATGSGPSSPASHHETVGATATGSAAHTPRARRAPAAPARRKRPARAGEGDGVVTGDEAQRPHGESALRHVVGEVADEPLPPGVDLDGEQQGRAPRPRRGRDAAFDGRSRRTARRRRRATARTRRGPRRPRRRRRRAPCGRRRGGAPAARGPGPGGRAGAASTSSSLSE